MKAFGEYVEEKGYVPLSTEWDIAREAWSNRQSLIDAHNARCEEECKRKGESITECWRLRGNGSMCAICPRRFKIEDSVNE